MPPRVLDSLLTLRAESRRAFAVLLDPDKISFDVFPAMLRQAVTHGVDYFLVGGSLITSHVLGEMIAGIRRHTRIPVILFPGSNLHIESSADAILFLSLISGRNPEFLIGQHVVAAPILRRSGLEILPTGYLLVDAGRPTTVSYISNTTPLPRDKPGVAACTAMAGEMLGLRLMYLDSGSGAQFPVPPELIAAVRQSVETPIIVGGGINSARKAADALEAGADVVVVGNGIEQNPDLLPEIAAVVKRYARVAK
ncbi:MAG: geranylgeranylglyceryl/heptaprenylglyceryl phosphate synthase [Cytophagaceae bacterium]|nr:geranylgeranylglyceryl/heptaprenylglyceryl phosphate synthase [Cytophagaceae bacterium]